MAGPGAGCGQWHVRVAWALAVWAGSRGPPGGGDSGPPTCLPGTRGAEGCAVALVPPLPGLGRWLMGHKRHSVPRKNDPVVWLEGSQETRRPPSLHASCRAPLRPSPACGPSGPAQALLLWLRALLHPALCPARPGGSSPILDSPPLGLCLCSPSCRVLAAGSRPPARGQGVARWGPEGGRGPVSPTSVTWASPGTTTSPQAKTSTVNLMTACSRGAGWHGWGCVPRYPILTPTCRWEVGSARQLASVERV